MRMWETSDAFPFRTLRALGIVILVHGVVILALGLFDVIWTVVKYTGTYDNCPTMWAMELEDPCDNNQLVWTWVGAGVWGGFLLLIVGMCGVMFSRWRVRNLRFQRDMFGVGCILIGFPICPAIIAVCVLELYYGEGVFYYMQDNELETEDVAKFIVPLLVGVFAFFAWVLGIAGAGVACCTDVGVQETLLKPQPMQAPMMQAPQMLMAPQVQAQPQVTAFEIVPIPQPAPPPYMVGPVPMGMGPPPMGMGPPPMGMGPPPMGMGPPMGPPMFGPPPFGPPFRGPPMPALMPPPGSYI